MKLLKQLLFELEYDKIIGDVDVKIQSIHFNSREVVKSSLFVANKGEKNDGHDYILNAINKGATAVIANGRAPITDLVPIIQVKNPRKTMSEIASNFYEHPSSKLKIIISKILL